MKTAVSRSVELSVDQTITSDEAPERRKKERRAPYVLEDFEKNELGF